MNRDGSTFAPLLQNICKLAMIAGFLAAPSLVGAADAEPDHESHSHHSYHPNVLGLFAGITHEGRRDNAPSLGIEYERRLNERFGIGALAEHVFSDHAFWIYAVPFAMHFGQWKAYAAPGVEDSSEHGSEFLLRIGAEYAFDLGSFEIAPQFDLDFVGGHRVAVLGVVFAKGF